ncbi:serine/threonine protein kinase, partial [Streptomyces ficellus]|nr:serine/threonine protein kinase [Streptomyces ficellus]
APGRARGSAPAAAPAALPVPAPPASATTYMLPTTPRQGRGRRSLPTAPRGGSAREFVRRRPRVASAIAGTVAFFAAVLIGMALFSPDSSSAETPRMEVAVTPSAAGGQ